MVQFYNQVPTKTLNSNEILMSVRNS